MNSFHGAGKVLHPMKKDRSLSCVIDQVHDTMFLNTLNTNCKFSCCRKWSHAPGKVSLHIIIISWHCEPVLANSGCGHNLKIQVLHHTHTLYNFTAHPLAKLARCDNLQDRTWFKPFHPISQTREGQLY